MSTITTPLIPIFYEGRFSEKKLYNIIQTPVGKPDLDTIALFKKIVDWYRPFTDRRTKQKRAKFEGEIWQIPYAYFEKIYKWCHDTVRIKLKKLEELGFIERITKTIVLNGKLIPNALHIKLNVSRLYDLFFRPLSPEISGENYNNNLSSLTEKKKDYYSLDILDILDARARARSESNFSKKSSLEGSDFLKNSSNLEPDLTFTAENSDRGCPNTEILANKREVPPPSEGENNFRGLESYLPLTERECLESAKRAERNFTSEETNFILRKISQTEGNKKYDFSSRERVINYAVKLLQNERREPGFLDNISPQEEKMPEKPEGAAQIGSYNITVNYFNKKANALESSQDEEEKRNYMSSENSVTHHTKGGENSIVISRETSLKGELVSVFEPGKAPCALRIRDVLKELREVLGKYAKYEARFSYLEEATVNEEEKLVLLKAKHRGAAFLIERDFKNHLDSFFEAKGYAYKLLFKQEDGKYGLYSQSWWSWQPGTYETIFC